MKYTVKNVTAKEQLDYLYNNSAFTVEGLVEESIPDLIGWLEENTTFTMDEPVVYVTKGYVMNLAYDLVEDNAYNNDLTIISVVGIDLMKIALKRFSVGGRWFDDIVDNNASRKEV